MNFFWRNDISLERKKPGRPKKSSGSNDQESPKAMVLNYDKEESP